MMIKSMGRTLLQVSLPTTLCANTIVVDMRMHICNDVCLSIFSSTLMCVYLSLPVGSCVYRFDSVKCLHMLTHCS